MGHLLPKKKENLSRPLVQLGTFICLAREIVDKLLAVGTTDYWNVCALQKKKKTTKINKKVNRRERENEIESERERKRERERERERESRTRKCLLSNLLCVCVYI